MSKSALPRVAAHLAAIACALFWSSIIVIAASAPVTFV
jgi:hypothetical protein